MAKPALLLQCRLLCLCARGAAAGGPGRLAAAAASLASASVRVSLKLLLSEQAATSKTTLVLRGSEEMRGRKAEGVWVQYHCASSHSKQLTLQSWGGAVIRELGQVLGRSVE